MVTPDNVTGIYLLNLGTKMKQDKETFAQSVLATFYTFTKLVAATVCILLIVAFITGTPPERNSAIDYPVADN